MYVYSRLDLISLGGVSTQQVKSKVRKTSKKKKKYVLYLTSISNSTREYLANKLNFCMLNKLVKTNSSELNMSTALNKFLFLYKYRTGVFFQ